MSRLLHVDGSQGASGDMILGALVELGLPLPRLRRALGGLPLGTFGLRSRRIERCSLVATKIDVRVKGHDHDHHHGRSFRAIEKVVRAGQLTARTRERALAIFRRLIEAEAEVHGQSPEKVHLHEVGGTDAIVDIVGACLGLEHLDVGRVVVSTLTTGFGSVRCAHGVYPVPAPATALLIRGVPVAGGEIEAERLTPTGAAILTTLADSWGPLPAMRPLGVGYGAGERDLGDSPNMLRMVLGDPGISARPAGLAGEVAVLECTVDDSTPQALAFAMERLFRCGALEAFTTPVLMKKGRAGHHLTVLARPERLPELAEVLLAETSSLGLRYRFEARIELERSLRTIRTPYGTVKVKIGEFDGRTKIWPEYDDCAALAERHEVPLWDIQRAAIEAAAPARPKRVERSKRSRT